MTTFSSISQYQSARPEFVAVYGRRRVGKTFLIRELFQKRFCFYHTGISPSELEGEKLQDKQLSAFHRSLLEYGAKVYHKPEDWFEAFSMLRELITSKPVRQRQVVFIDEMPWMDTPRSGFITALEHFWNGWGAGQTNLMLIVCGSSTTWITDHLINNIGGLYGRLTREIYLQPFTLKECEAFFKANGIAFDRYDQIQCYMAFGGIPYYLSLLQPGESLAWNIDHLFFSQKAPLSNEFERLCRSLFRSADDYMSVIRLLAKRHSGYTRKEIADATKLAYGGGLSKTLKSLEQSDFIKPYIPYQGSSRQTVYQLTDFFCLFYLTFVEGRKTTNPDFWKENLTSPKLSAWRGFAYERVCFAHIPQIKKALGISGVHAEISSWKSHNSEDGAQVDLLIDRNDRIINLCEIKYSMKEYVIDKRYDKVLRNKMVTFQEETKCRKAVVLTLITTYGLSPNEYANRIQKVLTMDCLF